MKLCKTGQQLWETKYFTFKVQGKMKGSIQGYLLKGFYSAQLPDHIEKGRAPAFPLSVSRKQDVSQVSIFLITHSPGG